MTSCIMHSANKHEKTTSCNLLSVQLIEREIMEIMHQKKLSEKEHPFFIKAVDYRENLTRSVSIKAAFEIARHWEIVTKTFMFTTLRSLSKFSEHLEQCDNPREEALAALQTGVHVISDDLNNNHPAFAQVAPHGPNGIHYKWWRSDIVMPLAKKLNINSWVNMPLSHNVNKLILGMRTLAKEPFGFAVQLRIVETVALHIAVAFRYIFGNVIHAGEKIFPSLADLSWITSHIRAEVTHHSQVSDNENGMAYVATTFDEQQQFLKIVECYADLWERALNDFCLFLTEAESQINYAYADDLVV